MGDRIRMTTSVAKVLGALMAAPDSDRYGLDLMHETGLPSGTLYPILLRLERAGWLDARWEDIDPVREQRPSRRYYRLTAHGLVSGRRELAELYRHIAPTNPAARKARLA